MAAPCDEGVVGGAGRGVQKTKLNIVNVNAAARRLCSSPGISFGCSAGRRAFAAAPEELTWDRRVELSAGGARLLPPSHLATLTTGYAALRSADCWVESYGPFGLVSPELVDKLALEDAQVVVWTQEWERSHGALQPMGHLCGGLYTRNVAQLAAHVSHYAGRMLGGSPVQPGMCLCLRTRDVAHTPARSELLQTLASLCTSEPAAPGFGHFCEAPNTAETLGYRGRRAVATEANKADCLNLHTDGSHQRGPVVGVCGARGGAAAATRAALLPVPAAHHSWPSPRELVQSAVWALNNVMGSLSARNAGGSSAAEPPLLQSLGARGTPPCGKLPPPCGWMVIVPNRAEFKRRGIMSQYDANEMYVLACHPGGGYAMGGADMQSLYLHGKLPVECTEAEAMHVMYILRYYQDFPAARLEALDASGLAPPAGTVLNVDWANPAASALRRTYVGGRVAKTLVHSAVATVNAAPIRERVPSAPVWLPGDQFRNHSILQLLALAPHCKGASLDFLKNTGALSALFLADESKKASDLEVDELSFASDDTAGGSAGAGAAPVQPLLRLVHYARRPCGVPLQRGRLRQLEHTRDTRAPVRLFIGRTHQLRRFFLGAPPLLGAAQAAATATSSSRADTAPFIIYLADLCLERLEERSNGTLIMRLCELPPPTGAAAGDVSAESSAHAHALLLAGGEAALRAHAERVAAHNAELRTRRLKQQADASTAAAVAATAGGAKTAAAPAAAAAAAGDDTVQPGGSKRSRPAEVSKAGSKRVRSSHASPPAAALHGAAVAATLLPRPLQLSQHGASGCHHTPRTLRSGTAAAITAAEASSAAMDLDLDAATVSAASLQGAAVPVPAPVLSSVLSTSVSQPQRTGVQKRIPTCHTALQEIDLFGKQGGARGDGRGGGACRSGTLFRRTAGA